MARTVSVIQEEIKSVVAADPVLSARLTSTSATAIWNLFTYVFAFGANVVERLYDVFVSDVKDIIATQKPHTLRWYVEKVKAFQYGYSLPIDTDVYDNSALTDSEVTASKIVKYAAATRSRRNNGRVYLRIKAAKEVGGDLGQMSNPEKVALDDYVFRIADAGVDYEIDSLPADKLKQKWTIYYDPELITDAGDRIDGTVSLPVKNGIKDYLKNLPFNGEYRTTYHQDAVQKIEGVVDCKLTQCQVSYGALDYTTVDVSYTPDAGYMRFYLDSDLEITYVPLSPIQ